MVIILGQYGKASTNAGNAINGRREKDVRLEWVKTMGNYNRYSKMQLDGPFQQLIYMAEGIIMDFSGGFLFYEQRRLFIMESKFDWK